LIRLRSLAAVLLPLAMLAACHKSPENDKRSATGEVLPGTTSDDMIPLGELTSQPPLLPPTSKGPATPEQAADKGLGGTELTDVGSEASEATPAPSPTSAAPASATP
jgi:hypothetical protein